MAFTNVISARLSRNADFRETTLLVDGEVRLRFAFAYGFRNIQNVVQQLKRQKCEFDFVEIMACPSGCVNGGGQIRSDLERVREVYEGLPRLSEPLDLPREEIPLLTEYRAIEKNLLNAFHLKW